TLTNDADDELLTQGSREEAISVLANMLANDESPALLGLQRAAAEAGVTFLWDDDFVSFGLGRHSQTFTVDDLPADVDWTHYSDVPVALVTGTNGKTTTVRLASRILRAAGLNVGLSSTDWIGVNDRIIDRGDYSGPGGARTVLRDKDVDAAILETARGGLLRRGLAVDYANAALITNIAEDHLGDFGSQNLEELLALKWLVTRVLGEGSTAVLNASDQLLVAKAEELTAPIIWFSVDKYNPILLGHIASGGTAFTVSDGKLGYFERNEWHALVPVADVPITMQGAAAHNIANALAAAGLCFALGADARAIVSGLISMQPNDNPGRCNVFHRDGVDILLDFAHNPDAMRALFDIAQAYPAKRRALCFGQAGDRTDAQIAELARRAWEIGLERVVISELADYRRGRAPGEVYGLLRQTLIDEGADPSQIGYFETEAASLEDALRWAEPGDLVIMLALGSATALIEWLST
ncbi:MAG: Mur ligase family protein, partial [Pseudomonadota bacterium]